MIEKGLPPEFVPMVTIGEIDGYLMVYTAEKHEDTIRILEQTLDVLKSGDKYQEMTLQ